MTIGERASIAHRAIVHGPCSVGHDVFIGFNSVLFNGVIGDGCELPTGLSVPSTERIGPDTNIASLRPVSVDATVFSDDVARTHNALVRGYKSIQNEF